MTETTTTPEALWSPNPVQPGGGRFEVRDRATGATRIVGPQEKFLASTANVALYGGAAGGGKSAAAIALPLRWVENGSFRCLYLRREAKYLSDALDKSNALYPKFGARLVQSPKTIWTFPSGAQVWLNHCEHEKDISNYDSLEFQVVIFEELQHFTQRQFLDISGRIRRTDKTLPLFTRATCNPGGPGHEWIFEHFGAWLNPKHPRPAKGGDVRWYRGQDEVPKGTPDSLSRQFIPATLLDNPFIGAEYRAQLMALDTVRRAQLLDGDWLVQPGKGLYFKRDWFPILDAAPKVKRWVRAWDLAASAAGDWTAGVKLGLVDDPAGGYVVGDVVRFRGTPQEVDAMVLATAHQDGASTEIRLPQDPGQAGVAQVAAFTRLLDGFTVRFVRPTGDKVTRSGPVSSQAQQRRVSLVRGEWTAAFVGELEAFPDGKFDDQVDALSDAHGALASGPATSRVPGQGRSGVIDQTFENVSLGG